MDRLRIGVVGTGTMGQRHCRVYSNLRSAELIGINDVNADTGSAVARQYDSEYFSELDDLLERVDAVSVAVPTPAHYDLARRCIEAGVHLLLEKPMTETLEQAESLVRQAERSRVVVQVGHIERFNPAYIELKHVLEDLSPLAIDLRRLSPYERSNRDVDVILDLMIHDLDLALDLMGSGLILTGAYGLSTSGPVDHALAHLESPEGTLLSVTASRVTEQKVRSIAVTALEAYLECDLLNKQILVHRHTVGQYLDRGRRDVKYRQESIVERIQVPGSEPLALELEHFVQSVLTCARPRVSAEDGLSALRLAHAVRGAIRARLVEMTAKERGTAFARLYPSLPLASVGA